MTRRQWWIHALAAAGAGKALAAQSGIEAHYRVDAAILLFGMVIFRRENVGEASLRIDSRGAGSEIEFAAGSIPERARGLNRLGYFLEQGGAEESRYFGFMTSSREESFAGARKALETQPGETIPYSVSEGKVTRAGLRWKLAHVALPARVNVREMEAIIPQVRAELAQASSGVQEAFAAGCPPRTFLHSVLEASSQLHACSIDYSFNSKRFTLTSKPVVESSLTRIEGQIRSWETGKSTGFQLWRKPGAGPCLPERFEYQPKAFLRLAFRRVEPSKG